MNQNKFRSLIFIFLVIVHTLSVPAVSAQEKNRFQVSGVNNDKEVERFFLDFQRAIAADNRKKVASMMAYPLHVNFYSDSLKKNYRIIRSATTFLKFYNNIFDNALKKFIAKTSTNDIWGNYSGIATPQGEIWIGVFCKGIRANKDCRDYEIKVRTIHANSVFIDRSKQNPTPSL